MPIVAWGEEYLLGIREFDEHHQHLVNLLNMTYDAYSFDPSNGNLEAVINELVDYADYHFKAEEKWMDAVSYPGYAQQKVEHEQFSEKISLFRRDSAEGRVTSSELLIFLADWLTSHILESDADYKKFASCNPELSQ